MTATRTGAHFLYISLTFFLHDYNVKRPSYSSYVGNVVCADQKFFFACVPVRIFLITAAHFQLADR